jgi:hypothetical protein
MRFDFRPNRFIQTPRRPLRQYIRQRNFTRPAERMTAIVATATVYGMVTAVRWAPRSLTAEFKFS